MKSLREIYLSVGLAILGLAVIIGGAVTAMHTLSWIILAVSISLGLGLLGFGFWNLISL